MGGKQPEGAKIEAAVRKVIELWTSAVVGGISKGSYWC